MAQLTALRATGGGMPGPIQTFVAKAAAADWLLFGIPFLYTSANWGTLGVFLEVFLKADAGTVYAEVYDVSASTQLTSSLVQSTASSLTRKRSSDFKSQMINGNVYRVRFGLPTGGAGQILGGKLVIT